MPRDTLLDFFHDFAVLDAEFLIHDDGFHARHFRYREIAERARAFAARLRDQGIRMSRLTGLTYFGAAETRGYNSLFQLTSLVVTGSGSVNRTYNYPTNGTNNGQISSEIRSGETITYQYDSLKRLISASSSSSWTDTYGYDAFGNLVSMTPSGGAPQLSLGVNPADNQIQGQTYDANGNELSAPQGGTLTYDSENRLLTGPGVQYAYDSANKRIWAGTLNGSGNLTAQEVFVYGANGHMLGEYSVTVGSSSLTVAATRVTVYFGRKRIAVIKSTGTNAFTPDALGSNGQFYPYGEIKGSNNPLDTWSFATYWRDSATGLDYANNRYFTNQFGRFMTPDPGSSSANAASPESWNLYTYVLSDPLNNNDPDGLMPRRLDHSLEATPVSFSGTDLTMPMRGADPQFVEPPPPPQPSPITITFTTPSNWGFPITIPGSTSIYTPGCGYQSIQIGMSIPPACWYVQPQKPPPSTPPSAPPPSGPISTIPGTNYCGPGGAGEPLTGVDTACAQHDGCYAAAGVQWYNYVLSYIQGPAMQQAIAACNQQLCAALLSAGYQNPNQAAIVGLPFGCSF